MSSKSVRWAFNASKWCPSFTDMLVASSCVQVEEKDRLSKFVFKKDVKSSLIGCLLMRKFVAENCLQPYNEIHLVRDEKGKPHYLDSANKIHFNVSHHGDYVVCVGEVGDVKVGVDLMKLEYTGGKPLPEFFRIMHRQFSPQEWATIKGNGNEKDQTAMFCRIWALKESYIKAIGVGINVNLQEISFKINTKSLHEDQIVDDTELIIKDEKMKWVFHESLLDTNHCVSVALDNLSADKVNFKTLLFEELIEGHIPLLENDESFVTNYFAKLDK